MAEGSITGYVHSGGEVVPAYNLRGTASYYKMRPLREPTTLLQNADGVFDGGSITNVGSIQNALPGQVGGRQKRFV